MGETYIKINSTKCIITQQNRGIEMWEETGRKLSKFLTERREKEENDTNNDKYSAI